MATRRPLQTRTLGARAGRVPRLGAGLALVEGSPLPGTARGDGTCRHTGQHRGFRRPIYLTPDYAPALSPTSDAALLFYGVSMLLAALRGYAGCEVLAMSNWLLRRDDQIGCLLFGPVDHLERWASHHGGAFAARRVVVLNGGGAPREWAVV